MSIKRLLNIALTAVASVGLFLGGILLGTTAYATMTTGGAILATIGLGLGAVALTVVAVQMFTMISNAIETEDFRAVDGVSEMIFDAIVANTIRIMFNNIVLSSLVTPKFPKFGRRNADSIATESDDQGMVTVTQF